MLRRTPLALLAAVALLAGGVARADDPRDALVNGQFRQAHGEMLVGLPSTKACTVTLVHDYVFRNTAYGPDLPYSGTYRPGCSGPWSRVVLTMSATNVGGTQFDRLGDVMLGGAELLHYTTPEGESGTTSWTVQRDVSAYASLLSRPQPVWFQLGNVTDKTYTGVFHGSLTLTFYATSKAFAAVTAPDLVLPVGTMSTRSIPMLTAPTQRLTSRRAFPRNLTRLSAEVFTSGHGGCEEDWWYQPSALVCPGRPYREAAVYVDGRLAGLAPIFPALFTGGWGPDWWRPIVGPRTVNLRPYTMDLTPFVGTLTDGRAHDVAVGILGWTEHKGQGDYWPTATNLLGWLNHRSSGRTTGEVSSYSAPVQPAFTGQANDDIGAVAGTFSHTLTVTGWTQAPGLGRATTTVSSTASDDVDLVVAAFKADWDWVSSSTTTVGDHTTSDATHSTYELVRDGLRWSFDDAEARTVQRDGTSTFTSSVDEKMQTHAPTMLTGKYGVSQDSWTYKDSVIGCVDHELAAAMNVIVRDDVTPTCRLL